ncbi:hypothetical protein V1503_22290 [Bacillus sp. SCS-151]|uniref:hypothetical protein n=1 Tax=Nanhaiella sioensis TaxID=3115293 RepID=UPI003979EE0C
MEIKFKRRLIFNTLLIVLLFCVGVITYPHQISQTAFLWGIIGIIITIGLFLPHTTAKFIFLPTSKKFRFVVLVVISLIFFFTVFYHTVNL